MVERKDFHGENSYFGEGGHLDRQRSGSRPESTPTGGRCGDCGGTGDCIHCSGGYYLKKDGTTATCGGCHARTRRGRYLCHACKGKGYGGQRCRMLTYAETLERREKERLREHRISSGRPDGTQEAGNTWVDGRPGYYEDGGSTGRRRRERYSGPNGPFGPGHRHDSSEDGGETWKRRH